jgi:ABC-type multidrug transport system ATPase subunit
LCTNLLLFSDLFSTSVNHNVSMIAAATQSAVPCGANSVAIELRKVTKSFGPVRALVGVSLTIEAGEPLAVLGSNGSGKSTLLAILSTLMKPSSGEISFGELGKTSEDVRGILGWVGHDLLCYPDLTGRENVELAASLAGISVNGAYAAVEARFGLSQFQDRTLRTYSRGQRQRIALARALVGSPQLLLLDEPTTGLDAAGVSKLGSVLQEERARGTTVVIVTHDAAFAAEHCARSVTIERGVIRPT